MNILDVYLMKLIGEPIGKFALRHMPIGIRLPVILIETCALCFFSSVILKPDHGLPLTIFSILNSILIIFMSKVIFTVILSGKEEEKLFPKAVRPLVWFSIVWLALDLLGMFIDPYSYKILSIMGDLFILSGLYSSAYIAKSIRCVKI